MDFFLEKLWNSETPPSSSLEAWFFSEKEILEWARPPWQWQPRQSGTEKMGPALLKPSNPPFTLPCLFLPLSWRTATLNGSSSDYCRCWVCWMQSGRRRSWWELSSLQPGTWTPGYIPSSQPGTWPPGYPLTLHLAARPPGPLAVSTVTGKYKCQFTINLTTINAGCWNAIY